MGYSLIGLVFAFAAGILLASHLPVGSAALWAAALLVAAVSLALRRVFPRALLGLFVCVALLGALRTQLTQQPIDQLASKATALAEVVGTVVSYPDLGDGSTQFDLQPDHIKGRVRVTWYWEARPSEPIRYGDRLQISGSARLPKRYPDFDYRAFLARQGIFSTMSLDGPQNIVHVGTGGSRLLRIGDTLRQRLLAALDRLLPPREAGLAHSLLFGERAALAPDVEAAFERTGLMHLLAVSGLHLGIFLAGLWFALRRLGLRPALAYPLVGFAVVAVLWIVGPRVSLIRAALLFAFLALGTVLADLGLILRRWVSPHQALAGAGLVLLALRPTALWDVGFQLSMAATSAILVAFDPVFGLQAWLTLRAKAIPGPNAPTRYALGVLTVSAAAQAGTAPILAYHFATIYPFVLLANLSAVPLAAAALWIGVVVLIFAATPLAGPLATGLDLLLRGLIFLVEGLASIPGSALPVPPLMGLWIAGLVGYLFLAVVYSGRSSCTSYGTSIVSGSEGRGGRSSPRVTT